MDYKAHILVCTNEKPGHCGQLCPGLYQAFKSEAAARGLQGILVSKTGCTEQHHCGPTVIVYPQGVWYKGATEADAAEIVAAAASGKTVERLVNKEISVSTTNAKS